MLHDHPQVPVKLGPQDRMSERGRRQLGLVLGAAGDGCTTCADDLIDGLAEAAAVGRLVEITRRTVATLNGGSLPSDLADETLEGGREFHLLVRTITEAADPAAAAGQMTEAQRRAASRRASRVLVGFADSSHQAARDQAASGAPTLPDVCLAQAELMVTWMHHQDPKKAAVLHDGWQRACEESGAEADAPGGEESVALLLGAVLQALAQEVGIRSDIYALPHLRALPLIRDREAVVRIVRHFVIPPSWEGAGIFVKRLAIDAPGAPAFVVLRLWADLVCAAYTAACPNQGPGHECVLGERAASLAAHYGAA
ncbi:hypothetical protein [Streptomyces sp. NPDC051561]|uniref:hypothetical protein n=1 Tax=Streptomyces sp. NPDC051561 TaxID=3365658 RepID=UPI0037B4ECFB